MEKGDSEESGEIYLPVKKGNNRLRIAAVNSEYQMDLSLDVVEYVFQMDLGLK